MTPETLARRKVSEAVRRGDIDTSRPCALCGTPQETLPNGYVRVILHHPDYSRPLDVTPLCRRCHNMWHREERRIRNSRTSSWTQPPPRKWKLWRARKGVSQGTVVRDTGLSYNTVGAVELGQRVSQKSAQILLDYYGVKHPTPKGGA